ncbi:undecaprenyldiphospho-muramoylpentapeptide beta-N-acetylglucosaminyltransferase [Jiulongibacter sediminis]|uniref:UDP-N-acetylglucosamine--N-acetylmuramyl-(pentapeptide) pyrophosphoryl-undecaprenol N-acetylglucosamine transferase n=1 Tax=Jiulongibacter sediminis TaxID=1605367 RepID=A0A0P7C167_9BACT|nr:undecaprenyldiphospho-muramoylpentapeptide beta-N-acetylglucosaminyltransferase [Jiulongibacter sediminis]KPM47737.1 UDP-diphospho-muramoylpentapeptide beta-N-acetylglucosaminyltransferase [Jiulongibacter sediminis]TBX23920.1 UDP-diphospho-muramoylpentapeptide beta-N-acetylglucosaminyltransferase [Jiulongibacter sediminis]
MSKPVNVIISGGGTGGHIYPAVAIANEIKAQLPEANILFVGAQGKMEMEKVPKAGYEIVGLPIAGINRSNMLANIGFPLKLLKSLGMARKTVKEFKPDIAIGVGGYASGPTLLMANMLGVKSLLQEQNSYAGITNKYLARKASKICVAYPEMGRFFPEEKVVFTGNPVRKDIIELDENQETALSHFGLSRDKKTILVIGGSQGALSINKGVAKGLDKLKNHGLQLIWQTGKRFLPKAKAAAEEAGYTDTYISDFVYEMDKAYAAADLVISRAGALSVSELCLTGKPAILVPFPAAAEDHQTKNALSLVNKEAALMVKDSEVNNELIDQCLELAENPQLQKTLKQNIKAFAKPNAAQDIVKEVRNIIGK